MENVGIIAEYNPFHNGHNYQLEYIKQKLKPKTISIIMSQDNVQRGEFASFDKFFRTEIALTKGVDFVLGLPFYSSNTSAEFFAKGSLKILNNFGVDTLVFGSESGNLTLLREVAEFLVDNEKKLIEFAKKNSNTSYPRILEQFLKENNKDFGLVRKPNNILSLEYLKDIYRNNYKIEPFEIKRIGSDYNDLSVNSLSSATAIREAIIKNNSNSLDEAVPYPKQLLLDNFFRLNKDRMFASLITEINNNSVKQLENIVGINSSLANKLKKAAQNSHDFNSFIDYLKSRDNLRTQINRVLLNILAHYSKNDFDLFFSSEFNPYFRLLGFSQNQRRLLSGKSPIIANVSRDIKKLNESQRKAFEYDLKIANLASLNLDLEEYNRDYLKKPIIL